MTRLLIITHLQPVIFLELQFPIAVVCVCVLSELNMEYNPSDHPRASTIFLSKSQTDGECVPDFHVVIDLGLMWE